MVKRKKPFWEISAFSKKLVMLVLGLFVILEILIYSPNISSFITSKFLSSSIINNTLISLTNDNRKENNEFVLEENALLSSAAQLKAEDMAKNGYFAHVSPSGVTPWAWLKYVGYKYRYAGENLAMNFSDSADVVAAWMRSSTHKKNILSENFTEIGIGVAEGYYKGNKTVFVVQFFGSPIVTNPPPGTGTNKELNQNNKINSFMSSSLSEAATGLIEKVFANINKLVLYLTGALMIVACLLLLLNSAEYQKNKFILAFNVIFVATAIFLFTVSFIFLSENKGVVAIDDNNASISGGF